MSLKMKSTQVKRSHQITQAIDTSGMPVRLAVQPNFSEIPLIGENYFMRRTVETR